MIRASNHAKAPARGEPKKSLDKVVLATPKKSPQKVEKKGMPHITPYFVVSFSNYVLEILFFLFFIFLLLFFLICWWFCLCVCYSGFHLCGCIHGYVHAEVWITPQ